MEDEEEGGIELEVSTESNENQQDHDFDAKLCVVGRFVTEGRVDFMMMKHMLAALWKPGKGVYMMELD